MLEFGLLVHHSGISFFLKMGGKIDVRNTRSHVRLMGVYDQFGPFDIIAVFIFNVGRVHRFGERAMEIRKVVNRVRSVA